jgi:hypothetical protein
MMSAECGGNWEKPAAPFLHDFSWMRRQHEAMNPELSLALLGAITVFFWLVAQAWTLLVMWAEGLRHAPGPTRQDLRREPTMTLPQPPVIGRRATST